MPLYARTRAVKLNVLVNEIVSNLIVNSNFESPHLLITSREDSWSRSLTRKIVRRRIDAYKICSVCRIKRQFSTELFGTSLVTPAAGTIKPEHIAEVSIHIEDFPTLEVFVDGVPQNSWCEDTRDKEAILVVKVRGTCNTNETTNHWIRVRHCCSSQTARLDPRPNGSGKMQGNLLYRADYQHLSSSFDVFNHLRNLRSP